MGFNIRRYDIIWGDDILGFTAEDSVSIPLQGVFTDVLSDQVEGPNDIIPRGVIPGDNITMTLQNSDTDFIVGTLLFGQLEIISSGTKIAGGIGFKLRNSEDIVKRLIFHPTGTPRSETQNDILFHKAFPLPNFELTSSKDKIQELVINFRIKPDNDQPVGFQYGIFGNWDITQATPAYVAITCDREVRQPVMNLNALTLSAGQKERLNVKKVFMVNDTVTFLVNDVGGYTAGDTTIIFDTLSSDNALNTGDYIEINNGSDTEIAFIENVVYTSATAGTVTLVRGVPSGTGISGANDDVFTRKKDVGIQDARDESAYVSSSPSNVTVGDVFPGTGVTRKGVIDHVLAGSSNITATVNAVASPNTVITAS